MGPSARILVLTVVGVLLAIAAIQGSPLQPAFSLAATFVILPVLSSAVLEPALSLRSIAVGSMLAVVGTILVGIAASLFPVEERPTAASVGLATEIAIAGGVGARLRRKGWSVPPMEFRTWRFGAMDLAVFGSGVIALTISVALAFGTPSQPTPFVSMSVTMPDGVAVAAVIEGKAGTTRSILVNIRNATPTGLSGLLIVVHPDLADSHAVHVDPGAEQLVEVAFKMTKGLSTARLELRTNDASQERLLVLQLRGT